MLYFIKRNSPLLFLSSAFGLSIAQFQQMGDSFSTLAFLIALSLLFYSRVSEVHQQNIPASPLWDLLSHQVMITFGILIGLALGQADSNVLWPLDAINTHIPLSEAIAQALKGERPWSKTGSEIQGAVSHSLTAGWFFLLGKSIYATTISLLCFKLLTICVLFRFSQSLFNTAIAYLTSMIYILAPTVQFYTLNFYKEACVHLLVISSFYFIYLIFIKIRLWALPALALSLFLMSQERFYLVFLFVPTIFILCLFSSNKFKVTKIILCALILGTLFKYNVYLQQSPDWMLIKLKEFRLAHMNLSGISIKYNYDIPYILAFGKSLFTPYFTLRKIETFFDLSNLLTWGSFFNQAIILSASYSFFHHFRKRWFLHLSLALPFLILLACLSYISPWSGRVRDSFYPLIAIYAGAFFGNKLYLNMFVHIQEIGAKIFKTNHEN